MTGLQRRGWAVAAVCVGGLAVAGCNVQSGKHGEGKDVSISTPFGGLQVRTNDGVVLESIGLAAYPGAVPEKHSGDAADGAADVDMHFGSFRLRVKAANYRTADGVDKVEAFYRNDLKRYGDVITCRGNRPVGEPERTLAGLTCEDEAHHHISVDEAKGDEGLQLKAGSRDHQHIVGLQPDHGGTKFALVVLDLPSGLHGEGK